MTALLEARGIVKRFGGFTALSDVSVSLGAGERLGIIGPNGSGKTTLMNTVSGRMRADAGTIRWEGREIGRLPAWRRARLGIARTFQIPMPFAGMTVEENLRVALEQHGIALGEAARAQASELLAEFGLEPRARDPAGALSQVELRRLELARAAASSPRVLISDEAMAGLSGGEIDEVLEMIAALSARGIAVIMIEHLMRAILRFSSRVVCLDAGRIIAEGTPEEVVAHPEVRKAYLGA